MTEERFEDFLKRTLDDLDDVPTPPREAMWAQIDSARRFQRRAERTSSRRVWVNWSVGFAAMLAIGIGIGRMTARPQLIQGPQTQTEVAARTGITDANPNKVTYQVAVAQHLSQAEALLTSFRTQPQTTAPDPQLAIFARDLLTSTQLLLDSPAADDPRVKELLGDLELILAQIAPLYAPTEEERDIIQDGMERTSVLPRLRATTAGPVQAGT